jgi:YD repeat-containing protein
MKIRIVMFFLLILSVLVSCKKEDLQTNGSLTDPYFPKLSKILVDNLSFQEYLYSDSNLIYQETSKFDFTVHHYNEAGQLTSTEFYANDDILSNDLSIYETAINQSSWVTPSSGEKGGAITYEYNADGQLIKTTTTRPSMAYTEYSEFIYDASNRISRQSMYWENTGTGYIDYTYDKNGNLASEILYSLSANSSVELITSTKYSYDNEQNPFRSYSKILIPGINTNANNVIREIYTINLESADGSDNVQITENTYKYDVLGYPVSKNGNVTYIY